ncbi:peptidoglycan-binding protein [Phytobacter diazotrophicus]|jgi:hypothetical protein|uniref:peptidoglycan-binding protein n=1 Tax=Phytobacter diazotrophicus TaxID=395631 RepID=UPI001451B2BA|nr:peptidoglycan-binding protein [Phytobacter diazotrophicus]QJF19561.1 peptidoglycan-binding protein [Phytobacter diazotrophicus]
MADNTSQFSGVSGSVGTSGMNNPNDVKALQKMIIDAGYNHIRGNNIRSTGKYDPETEAAIVWYQRLLNMSPSGLIHPVETMFFSMFAQSISPGWRPRHVAGPLNVKEGQITFDAEGKDYITAVEPFRQPKHIRQFSRILHWPEGDSGVTIGRGYDMKKRSAGRILTEMRQSGIEEYRAIICSKAAGLYGRNAFKFVKDYGPLVGEITHIQQIQLFDISYSEKREYAKFFYKQTSLDIGNDILWEQLDLKIRDVIVDIFFQGVHDVTGLIKSAIKGRIELINYIKADSIYMSYESNRQRIRYLQ